MRRWPTATEDDRLEVKTILYKKYNIIFFAESDIQVGPDHFILQGEVEMTSLCNNLIEVSKLLSNCKNRDNIKIVPLWTYETTPHIPHKNLRRIELWDED